MISIVSVIANCLLLYTFELTKRSSTDNQLERGLTDRLCHSIRHNNGQLYYAVWKKKRMSCRGCVGVIISMYVCMYTSVYIGSPACASVSLCVRACVCVCLIFIHYSRGPQRSVSRMVTGCLCLDLFTLTHTPLFLFLPSPLPTASASDEQCSFFYPHLSVFPPILFSFLIYFESNSNLNDFCQTMSI